MTKKKPGEQFVTTLQALLLLQVLPDDPRDDVHGHATLHIQAGDGKGHIILLSEHPVVVAEVGYSIDTVVERDIDHADLNIGELSCILALDAALLQVVAVSVFRSDPDVGPDAQVLQAVAPYTVVTDQLFIAHSKPLMGVADPVPGKVPCQN